MIKNIMILAISWSFAGCATFQGDITKQTQGEFKGKALVKDKESRKSQVVNIKAKSVYPNKLRIDVTTAIGVHVFSLAMVDDHVEYILPREKKYFFGKSSDRALRAILKIPMDPKVFQHLLFQRSVPDKNWTCTMKDDRLHSCNALRGGIKIEWNKPKKDSRLVEIDSRSTSVQINLTSFDENFEETPDTFKLKVPTSFQRLAL